MSSTTSTMLNLCRLASASFRRMATGPTRAALGLREVELVVVAQPRSLQGVELFRVARDEPALLAEVAHRPAAAAPASRAMAALLAATSSFTLPTSPPSVAMLLALLLRLAQLLRLRRRLLELGLGDAGPLRDRRRLAADGGQARVQVLRLLVRVRGLRSLRPGDLLARVAQPDEEIDREPQRDHAPARCPRCRGPSQATLWAYGFVSGRPKDRIHASSCPFLGGKRECYMP